MAVRVALRWATGSMPLILQVSIGYALWPKTPPSSPRPTNRASLGLRAIGRIKLSTLSGSISTQLS